MAFVSIILPVYNGEKYLRKALQSVKDQTFKDWECIIVDDCSTDKSPEIINEFLEDNRFSLVKTPKNLGFPGSSRNVGLNKATGQWLGFLDQDDILTNVFLEKMTNAISNDVDLVGCMHARMWENDGISPHQPPIIPEGIYQDSYSPPERVFIWNKLYRASIIKNNNIKFPDSFAEDVVFNLIFWAFCRKMRQVGERLYNFRCWDSSSHKSEKFEYFIAGEGKKYTQETQVKLLEEYENNPNIIRPNQIAHAKGYIKRR